MWLSILVPSIYPEKLERFRQSLMTNLDMNYPLDFEIVSTDKKVEKLSEAFNDCFESASGEWIWIANDDLICRTRGWNKKFYQATSLCGDGYCMYYPNDLMFMHEFACFPLARRDVVKDLFPMNFRRYKIDDSIQDLFPAERRHYLEDVIMEHENNNEGNVSYMTVSGKAYKTDLITGKLDSLQFEYLAPRRKMIRESLCKLMKKEYSLVR